MDNWFNRIWAPVATFIGIVLLVNQLAEAFTGNRTLVTGLLILGALMFIVAGMSKFAFAKSSIPGIPQYKFHWFAKIAIIPILGFALFSAYYVLSILDVAPDCCGFVPTQTSTVTGTAIPTSTFTSTPNPTPTPKVHGTYYMIVLDASLKMQESFDGKTKWDAALEAINAILRSREEEANYGLVVIGSSELANGADPCTQPSSLTLPFSSRKSVMDHINQLQLSGGGSIFEAFNLAKDQFRTLPENTTRTLIFITGSSDACDSRDEWRDLERAFNFPGGIGVEQYSEIIVLEQDKLISRTIEEQFASLTPNLNVQSPTNFVMLNQTNNSVVNNVINNVSDYIAITISSFPTNTTVLTSTNPLPITPDVIFTTKPSSVVITTSAPTFTAIPPTPIPPTVIPPTDIPPTDLAPTQAPPMPEPSVQIQFNRYIPVDQDGCDAEFTVNISGPPITGSFHVWNAFYPPEGDIYSSITFTTLQEIQTVGLGGDLPDYHVHKVWFEYNGTSSNIVEGLICPHNQ